MTVKCDSWLECVQGAPVIGSAIRRGRLLFSQSRGIAVRIPALWLAEATKHIFSCILFRVNDEKRILPRCRINNKCLRSKFVFIVWRIWSNLNSNSIFYLQRLFLFLFLLISELGNNTHIINLYMITTMDQVWKRKHLNIFFHHRILEGENIFKYIFTTVFWGEKIYLNIFSPPYFVGRKYI